MTDARIIGSAVGQLFAVAESLGSFERTPDICLERGAPRLGCHLHRLRDEITSALEEDAPPGFLVMASEGDEIVPGRSRAAREGRRVHRLRKRHHEVNIHVYAA